MKTRFDPLLQALLPLPLSRLYALAFRSPGARERHDRALHLAEANLKLFAATLAGRYRSLGLRSARVDAALQKLVMPALGHWRDLAIETLFFLGEGCDAGSWAGRVLAFTLSPFGDAESRDALAVLRSLAGWPGQPDTGPLGFLGVLPAYRNAMSGAHGGIKVDQGAYELGASALLTLVRRIHRDGRLLGGACLCLADEVRLDRDGSMKMTALDLTGPSAIRRFQLEDADPSAGILPGSLYLETPTLERISLHPFLWHQTLGASDRVLFLNRARDGAKGIVFLCYETGELHGLATAEGESALARDVAQVLDWSKSHGSPTRIAATPRPWAMDDLFTRSDRFSDFLPGDRNEPDALDFQVIHLPGAGEAALRDGILRPGHRAP